MPPRWPRKPDRNDPAYRRLADRINFAIHVATFAAINSGLWFVVQIKQTSWPWLVWFSGGWGVFLLLHLVYIAAIADYTLKSDG